jgi:hypothetical protein
MSKISISHLHRSAYIYVRQSALVQFGGLPIFQRPDGLKAVRWLGS